MAEIETHLLAHRPLPLITLADLLALCRSQILDRDLRFGRAATRDLRQAGQTHGLGISRVWSLQFWCPSRRTRRSDALAAVPGHRFAFGAQRVRANRSKRREQLAWMAEPDPIVVRLLVREPPFASSAPNTDHRTIRVTGNDRCVISGEKNDGTRIVLLR
jgi:hypothetical protein